MAWFNFLSTSDQNAANEIPEIFPVSMLSKDFISIDVQNIYTRILTDVLERTQGIDDNLLPLFWDNCLASESSKGLVTMIAEGMLNKSDLFLVYVKEVKVIRKATSTEEQQIRADYKKMGESSIGIFVTFKELMKTDILKIYSELEYCSIVSVMKQANLSKAIQIKINALRESVALSDSADAKAQAVKIAEALRKGKDILLDAKDIIETAKPDLTATNSMMDMVDKRRSLYTGLPAVWITGQTNSALSNNGDGDAKNIEKGLKNYYYSIVKPIVEKMFSITTTFKSEDFRQIQTSLSALQTFEATSDEYLSAENKQLITNKLFGLSANEKGGVPQPNADTQNKTPGV